MSASNQPRIELLRIGKKTFRVPQISGQANDCLHQEKPSTMQWRNAAEQSQKLIEADILKKQQSSSSQVAGNSSGASQSTWEGQWGGDARVMRASELTEAFDTGDFSHFISISLYRDEKLMKKLQETRVNLSSKPGAEHLLKDARRAHIPLVMLKLNTPARQKKAIECMHNSESILRLLADGIKTFSFKQGVTVVGKTATAATEVLWEVEEGAFKEFCNEAINVIVAECLDFGLFDATELPPNIVKENGRYNAQNIAVPLYRVKQSASGKTFDATEIISTLQHLRYDQAKLHTMDLSTRHHFMQQNGYYQPIQSFTLAIN